MKTSNIYCEDDIIDIKIFEKLEKFIVSNYPWKYYKIMYLINGKKKYCKNL